MVADLSPWVGYTLMATLRQGKLLFSGVLQYATAHLMVAMRYVQRSETLEAWVLGACFDAVLLAPGDYQISRDITEDNNCVRVVTDFLGLPTGSFTSISALGYVPDTADPIHAHPL